MALELDMHMQKKKKELGFILCSICKNNSKWSIDLNGKPKTIKLLEENIRENDTLNEAKI